MRPTALGQGYTSYACVLCIFVLCVHILGMIKNRNTVITKKNFIIIVTSITFWLYLVVHALLVGSNGMDNVLKAATYHVLIIFTFAIILSSKKENFLFFHWFIKILFFFSLSYTITVVLGTFVGGIENLHLFNFKIETYNHPALVYFPFTSLSSFMIVGNIHLPRFLGMFREPGILQAFLIWAFFNLEQYKLNSKKIKFTLAIGIFGTFSTAGIAIFIGTIAMKYFLNRKVLKSILIVSFCIIALVYTPYIGVKSKSINAAASVDERSYATKVGLEKFMDNPIGTGMYNHGDYDMYNAGINLLSSSYMIGAIGLFLILLVYFLPMYKYPFKTAYLVGITPLLITSLYSQPILDAPLVYIMLMANYGIFAEKPEVEILKTNISSDLRARNSLLID